MINHFYFSNIDTEIKAYMLGFIYADGCVIAPSNYNNKPRAGRLSISIQISDEYIIDRLSNDLRGKPGVVRYTPSQIKNSEQKQKILNVSSAQIYSDLVKLGCYPNKTKVGMLFPNLEDKLIPHFIRGFFDGDGCLTVDYPKSSYISRTGNAVKARKPIRGRITFTSTDKTFLDTLLKHIPTSGYYYSSKQRTQIVNMLHIERQKDVVNVLNYMYQNSSIHLKRKEEKMNMLISSQVPATVGKGSETT